MCVLQHHATPGTTSLTTLYYHTLLNPTHSLYQSIVSISNFDGQTSHLTATDHTCCFDVDNDFTLSNVLKTDDRTLSISGLAVDQHKTIDVSPLRVEVGGQKASCLPILWIIITAETDWDTGTQPKVTAARESCSNLLQVS